MKNKMLLLFYLNLFSLLVFTACEPAPCPEYEVKVDTIYFPDIYKLPLNSYKGFDTLKFTTEIGDTIIFMSHGFVKGYNQVDIFAEDECSTKSSEMREFEGITFYPLSSYSSTIEYYVSSNLKPSGTQYLYIIINKIQFIRFPYFPPATSSSYIHILEINGKVYENVLTMTKDQTQGNKNYLYYNMENGILQINFESGHSLSKLK
jgi:hypothetical protein